MAVHKVKFITIGSDADNAGRTESDPVTLRMQFEDQPELDSRAFTFKDRATLERVFEFLGLAPALLTPLDLEGFWTLTDEQLAGLADGSLRS